MPTASQIMQYLDHVAGAVTVPRDSYGFQYETTLDELAFETRLPIHRTEAGFPRCATCDGGGCYDCTDPA